ncbi:MAG: zinc-dependent alcohol dehydrogenase [Solirubrobacterales bacterium]
MGSSSESGKARAVWFTAPRTVELRDERLSMLGDDDLLVKGLVSLVSAGTEMNVYRGESATPAELDMPTTAGEFPFPIKFAYQIVGEVEEAGSNAPFRPGDRVFAYHPHQERFVIGTGAAGDDDILDGATLVFPVPAELDPERAAFANLFCVAYNGLLDAPVRVGDCVAVSGLGVIGSFAAHLARRTAARLILVDPLPERRERAAWIEADAVVHPDDAAAAVEELSEGRNLDIFFEASGATPALQTAIDNTGQEGTIVVLSYFGDRKASLCLSPQFHLRRQRVISSMVGMIGSGLQPRWDARRRMMVAMEHLAALDVGALTSHRLAFDEAPTAYKLIDTKPQDTLGVLLEY